MTRKKLEEEIRYKENPFLEDLEIVYKKKQVRVNTLGKNNNVLLNEDTGEVKATHVVTYRKVDGAEFIKLFAKNIALTFDMTAAGFKVLMVVSHVLQYKGINRDIITLDSYAFDDFIEAHKDNDPPITNFSLQTFLRGLRELVGSKILAKCMRRGDYFINPKFVFNGDRVVFSTVLERRKTDEKTDEKTVADKTHSAAKHFELIQEFDGALKANTDRTVRQKEKPIEHNFLNDSMGDL
jgi:hypothetical protein